MDRTILDQFRGRWSIEREIRGEGATLTGKASFEPAAEDALAYRECGIVTLSDGRSLATYRSYVYRPLDGGVEIDFADGPDSGKPFVRLVFLNASGTLVARDVHHCGNDAYTVTYALALPDTFATDIEVTGPRKVYRVLSRYRRV